MGKVIFGSSSNDYDGVETIGMVLNQDLNIGKAIYSERIEKGLTQKELADILNVTPQVVSNWERGYSSPNLKQLCSLSYIFEVSTDYLLVGIIFKGGEENRSQE